MILTEDSKKQFYEIYNDYLNKNQSLSSILKKYDFSKSKFYLYLHLLNLPYRKQQYKNRKYKLNENSFKKETRKKYYWLGFIAADGCVNKKAQSFSVQLKSTDKKQLENLKEFLEADCTIKEIVNNGGHDTVKISINSKIIKEDLKFYNIVPAKSLIYTIPIDKIPNIFIMDFIRGMVDGDGTINFTKKGQITFGFLLWK